MVYLRGIGHFHPETVWITNSRSIWTLASRGVDLAARWGSEGRTVLDLDYIGRTRNRFVRAAHEASSHSDAQSGKIAAEIALSRARLKASDISGWLSGVDRLRKHSTG